MDKTFCFLGDSITMGVAVNEGERYHDSVARFFNVKNRSFGVNGAQSSNLLAQIDKMRSECDKPDRIFVLIGTNDYCAGVPIGGFFSEKVVEVVSAYDENNNPVQSKCLKKRELITSESTFCGRLNAAFLRLKELYPLAKLTIITPPHRAYAYFGGCNVQYDELYANASGIYFDEYVAAIRKCADIWSASLIDVYRESGLFPLNADNAREYFANEKTDRLHPNASGHEIIARLIIKSIIAEEKLF